MIRSFCNFVKISATVIVVTVLLSGIALRYISDLSMENFDLRRQTEGTSQTTACRLHICVLPMFGIHWLTYDFPMETSGETLPTIHFPDCFFLSLSVTAQ